MAGTANNTGWKSFYAASSILEGQRVKLSGIQVDVAAAADKAIGVAECSAVQGGLVTVKLFSAPGTFMMRAGAAIVAGAQLYPVASGNVDDAGTTALNFVAMEAATALGDVIECARVEIGA